MNLVEFYFYYIIEKIYFFINIQNILFKTINVYIFIFGEKNNINSFFESIIYLN